MERARLASLQQPQYPLASATVGDARELHHSNQSADVVLMLGPLYRLITKEDRLTALHEAHRVLHDGALILAAAISRFASLPDSPSSGFFDQTQFAPILDRDLDEGQHRNPTGKLDDFTEAMFPPSG